MMENRKLAQSYIWHGADCFFVSTIDREDSAGQGFRYAETLIWEYDYATMKRGESIVAQTEDCTMSIAGHLRACSEIAEHGELSQ